jgi:A/G-specific adenine glycosylase
MEDRFTRKLISWYQENKRDLPWRHEKDAYKIWLSEIILQQTQVVQGLNYYLKFVSKYPHVTSLAKAPEDEVLHLWQGLGYYSRARNLHAAAKHIVKEHKGVFPTTYETIRALKGVGDYTAAAIAGFAYNLPYAVVDGNVYRLLSRVFGIYSPIDSSAGKKEFQALATQLLDKKDPATYNQAIMEFGSQYCKPSTPDCEQCILNTMCYAYKHRAVKELPTKAKKTKIKNRYFNYLLLKNKKGEIRLHRRNSKDIWKGLYEFTLIESDKELSLDALMLTTEFKQLLGKKFGIKFASKQYKHVLSHQHLYAKFYLITISEEAGNKAPKNKKETQSYVLSKTKQLKSFAFPRLIGKFLDDCLLKEIL